MFYKERQQRILEYIREKPLVSVAELSVVFQVSAVTIRKDLNELSEEGKIERTHGGAVCVEEKNAELPQDPALRQALEKKKSIARKALKLISEGDTILLDAGSTTLELAKMLEEKHMKGVTVITHALQIANVFNASREYTLIIVGGQYRYRSTTNVGPYAVQMLKNLHADKCFLGINGYTAGAGLTTQSPYEAEMKRMILSRSRECYLLTDSGKYGTVCMSVVGQVSDLAGVITDDELPEKARRELMDKGVRIY